MPEDTPILVSEAEAQYAPTNYTHMSQEELNRNLADSIRAEAKHGELALHHQGKLAAAKAKVEAVLAEMQRRARVGLREL